MVKKLLMFLLSLFLIFGNNTIVEACSVPPDIIINLEIKEDDGDYRMNYRLNTWSMNKNKINDFLKKNNYSLNEEEGLKRFSEEFIKKNLIIKNENEKELNYEIIEGTFKTNSNPTITGDPLFSFDLDIKEDEDLKNGEFIISYDKEGFKGITYFSHLEVFSNLEGQKGRRESNYSFQKGDYLIHIKRESLESDNFMKINFEYKKEKKEVEIIKDNKSKKNEEEENIIIVEKKENKKNDGYFGLLNGKTIQEFFNEKINRGGILLVVIFSFLFGAIHGLLPGHSKSLLGAYVLSNEKNRYKDLLILIVSTTISHSFFIFIIAGIFFFLNQGLGNSSGIILKISSFIYIFFGVYFLYSIIKDIRNKNHKHSENCNCHLHNKISLSNIVENNNKKTLIHGILFGANPCLDALLLFVFFFGTGDIIVSLISVVIFSLGLGFTLGVISLFFLLTKKVVSDNNTFTNISYAIRIILGFFILIIGINGVI